MRRLSGRERHMGRCHIGDGLVQIAVSGRADGFRHVVYQRQDHGDVVRGKTPQRVLVGADLSQIEPAGRDVVDSAKRTFPTQRHQLEEGRMVLQQMSDHQHAALSNRQFAKRQAVLCRQ